MIQEWTIHSPKKKQIRLHFCCPPIFGGYRLFLIPLEHTGVGAADNGAAHFSCPVLRKKQLCALHHWRPEDPPGGAKSWGLLSKSCCGSLDEFSLAYQATSLHPNPNFFHFGAPVLPCCPEAHPTCELSRTRHHLLPWICICERSHTLSPCVYLHCRSVISLLWSHLSAWHSFTV